MDQGLLAEFLAECGLEAPYRVEVFSHDDATTRSLEFRQPFLVVGQRERSDLRLDHWLVGRRHVYLQLIEGRFRCIDLGARTGTHGGDPTERAGWVDPDRPLKIGPYLVRPVVAADPARDYPPLPIVTWSKAERPDPDPDAAEPHWSMNRALALVGRSPFCEFRVADPATSRFHCGLVLTAKGVWVVDLLSQRPVLVNGEAVRFAPVRPGDVLQVGSTSLTPHYDMSLIRAVRERGIRPGLGRPSAGFPGERPEDDVEGSSADLLPALAPSVVVPTGYWNPAPPAVADSARLGSNELVVTALVEQFGAMQQQMFDQFHQMMLGMFERFAELHRETSASVRAEFEEVRKLSDEIESLRAETSRLAEASTLAIQQSALDRSSHHQPGPARAPVSGPATTPPPIGPAATRPGAIPPSGPLPPPAPASAASGSTRRSTTAPVGSGTNAPDDIHAQLCLRLSRIETERQGKLQKIWAMMMTSRA